MDRLSALDAEFLHLEDGSVHMAIAGACVFDDPPPSPDDVNGSCPPSCTSSPAIGNGSAPCPSSSVGRCGSTTRFRPRLPRPPYRAPGPGDDAAFCRLMGRLMSQPLDRDRPLWEAWLVEGL